MNDNAFNSVAVVSAALVLIAVCIFGKGCNDSNNALYKDLAEHGCTYYGENKYDCSKGVNK